MTTTLVLVAIALAAASGVPSLFLAVHRNTGQRIATALQMLAAALGLLASCAALVGAPAALVHLPLNPLLPALSFGLDPLSAAFLVPACLIGGCVAVYDLGYWRQSEHPTNGRRLRFFAGLLSAALMAVPLAQDGIAFLVAWEVMAISAFFLIGTEDQKPEVRAASWTYLVATHAGTLALIALFALAREATGDFALRPESFAGVSAGERDALFLLTLGAFGLKAGIVPLHFWLPPAHANAPSHVSAVLSGVVIKMGVYGVLRMCMLFPSAPAWWAVVLLAAGGISALVGVAFAIGQHDLKRLLAYHSIENIGIIFLGIGLGMAGRAADRPDLALLGFTGALLHVWNHAIFKGLLFLAAGSAIRAAGTRSIDLLGGLSRRMPWTAAGFLVGAVAICGLPPLNGFVSEVLLYLGFFRALDGSASEAALAATAVPVLASAGAMALLCFAKVFGVVFLGWPRSEDARCARESGPALLGPMAVLVACCAAIGLLPYAIVPGLARAVATLHPGSPPRALADLAPLGPLGFLAAGLLGGCGLVFMWLRRRRTVAGAAPGTWNCGYIGPDSPRQQYTASSFSQMFVALSGWLLRPWRRSVGSGGLFPAPRSFHTEVPDPVLDRGLLPALRALARVCTGLRLLHRGRVQTYLLYVFLTLLVLLMLG